MIRVIVESPFAPRDGRSVDDHIDYARRCVRDCVLRGEAPIASHLLFTQPGILKDEIPDERALGIEAGLAWAPVADCSVFYTDCGWSSGMLSALHRTLHGGRPFRLRALDGRVKTPTVLCEDTEAAIKESIDAP